jgi:predicted nuclease of restriction endonuclease-like (RecB) superfamily
MAKKKKVPSKKAQISINVLPEGYGDILEEIKGKIKAAQLRALTAVNQELISVYWEIGRTIHDKQQADSWGTSVVEHFARDLQKAFPGMKGFSPRNLWRMKDLYTSYEGDSKLTTLSAEISWSHNIAILEKCQDVLEKEFYMRMSRRNGWIY